MAPSTTYYVTLTDSVRKNPRIDKYLETNVIVATNSGNPDGVGAVLSEIFDSQIFVNKSNVKRTR